MSNSICKYVYKGFCNQQKTVGIYRHNKGIWHQRNSHTNKRGGSSDIIEVILKRLHKRKIYIRTPNNGKLMGQLEQKGITQGYHYAKFFSLFILGN